MHVSHLCRTESNALQRPKNTLSSYEIRKEPVRICPNSLTCNDSSHCEPKLYTAYNIIAT